VETETLPSHWKSSQEAWKKFHPTWEYKLWTDEDNRQLIESKFNWFLPIYDSYPYNIQRADAVRYCILYEFGGVYSDLDLEPVKPIDAIFETCQADVYLARSRTWLHTITNSFMAEL